MDIDCKMYECKRCHKDFKRKQGLDRLNVWSNVNVIEDCNLY